MASFATAEHDGPLLLLDRTVVARFWTLVAIGAADACWPWLGDHWDGKPQFRAEPRRCRPVTARRLAYALAYGGVPKRMVVAATCRSQSCMNPRHLAAWPKTSALRAAGLWCQDVSHRLQRMARATAALNGWPWR